MKLVLFSIIFISGFLAISAFLTSGLGWAYFPSSAVGVAFYEHNNWLVFIHVLVGLVAMCCWPSYDNRKIIVWVGVAFFLSIIVHLGSKSYHSEKEMTVEIGSFSYSVSSLELPTVDLPRPYGPSPFRPYNSVLAPAKKIQSLHYSPQKQYGYPMALNVDESNKFFLVIHSAGIDGIGKSERSILIWDENRILEFYPAEPFSDPEAINIFQKFINENLSEIKNDVDAKLVSTSSE